jgi:hypothetical protein
LALHLHYSFNHHHLTNSSLLFQSQGIIKMTTQEGEDINEPFIEKDWIGQGRIYNATTIPTFVILARSKVAEIPQIVTSAQLPNTNLSVTDFLSCELPRVSSEPYFFRRNNDIFSYHPFNSSASSTQISHLTRLYRTLR